METVSFNTICMCLSRWDFAKKNKIVLVDEYDQIMRDVEPFWAL